MGKTLTKAVCCMVVLLQPAPGIADEGERVDALIQCLAAVNNRVALLKTGIGAGIWGNSPFAHRDLEKTQILGVALDSAFSEMVQDMPPQTRKKTNLALQNELAVELAVMKAKVAGDDRSLSNAQKTTSEALLGCRELANEGHQTFSNKAN